MRPLRLNSPGWTEIDCKRAFFAIDSWIPENLDEFTIGGRIIQKTFYTIPFQT